MTGRLAALVAILACLAGAGVRAEPALLDPPTVQRYVEEGSPTCRERTAQDCIGHWWLFLDADGDGRVDAAELRRARESLGGWLSDGAEILTLRARAAIFSGLWLFDRIGPERLVRWYDLDGDGALGPDELLSDFRLDGRPLPEVAVDPDGIDTAALRERFGPFSAAVLRLIRWLAVE